MQGCLCFYFVDLCLDFLWCFCLSALSVLVAHPRSSLGVCVWYCEFTVIYVALRYFTLQFVESLNPQSHSRFFGICMQNLRIAPSSSLVSRVAPSLALAVGALLLSQEAAAASPQTDAASAVQENAPLAKKKKKKDADKTDEKAEEKASEDDVLGGDEPAKEPAKTDGEGEGEGAQDPEREVKYGGEQVGTTVGGATGFAFKKGFYASSELGGFFRFGGFNDSNQCGGFRCKPVAYSNLQPYIGLSLGYDVLDWLAVQASFGSGFIASAAPVQNQVDSPKDHGITFLNVGVLGSWYFYDRLALTGKLAGGLAVLSPAPLPDASPIGGNFDVGIGLRYATLLTDVTIGVDVDFRGTIASAGSETLFIPGLSFAPVVQYVFGGPSK